MNKLLQKTITKLVESSFKDGKMMESQVIKAIYALKTLPKTDAIWALSEYLKGIKREERKHIVYIETAIPIPQSILNKIKRIVGKRVRVTKVVTQVNPEILGGFKLKVGDEVWDQSILDQINQVKEVIAHGRSNSAN